MLGKGWWEGRREKWRQGQRKEGMDGWKKVWREEGIEIVGSVGKWGRAVEGGKDGGRGGTLEQFRACLWPNFG